jgi:Protein of unknown function (DUF4232)
VLRALLRHRTRGSCEDASARTLRSASRSRLALAAGLLLCGAGGGSLFAQATGLASASARSAIARCRTSGLDIWLNNEGGGGTAGSVFYKLELTNLSGRACSLEGYPRVTAVSLGGGQIGKAASRESSVAPRLVTLAVGRSAVAVVRVVDTGALPKACRARIAAGFRVYPPGQNRSRVVPFPFMACAHGANLAVRSVQPG